jgi:hypothetical protein
MGTGPIDPKASTERLRRHAVSFVVESATDLVVGVGERLGQRALYAGAAESVRDLPAGTGGDHKPARARPGEVPARDRAG